MTHPDTPIGDRFASKLIEEREVDPSHVGGKMGSQYRGKIFAEKTISQRWRL